MALPDPTFFDTWQEYAEALRAELLRAQGISGDDAIAAANAEAVLGNNIYSEDGSYIIQENHVLSTVAVGGNILPDWNFALSYQSGSLVDYASGDFWGRTNAGITVDNSGENSSPTSHWPAGTNGNLDSTHLIPVTPGEVLFFRWKSYRSAAYNGTFALRVRRYDLAQTHITNTAIELAAGSTDTWVTSDTLQYTVPADTHYILVRLQGTVGSVGLAKANWVWLSRTELAATVGATWGTDISNEPTELGDVNATEGTKLTGIEDAATLGATANDNIVNEIWTDDDFGDNDLARTESTYIGQSGEVSIEALTTPIGGYAWRCGDNSGNDGGSLSADRTRARPVSSGEVYKISAIWRQNLGFGATASTYIGVAGYKGDVRNGNGSAVNTLGVASLSSQHYFATASNEAPDANWITSEGYFIAGGAYAFNAGTLVDPHVLHADVEYVVPLLYCNNSGETGQFDLAWWSLEKISLDSREVANAAAVSQQPLSGTAIQNPNFVLRTPGTPSRPAGWWDATGSTQGTYVTGTDDQLDCNSRRMVSSAFRVDPEKAYRVTVSARGSVAMTSALDLQYYELDTELDIAGGEYAVGGSGGESGTTVGTRLIATDSINNTLTTSYQTFTGTFYPTSTALWCSLAFWDSGVAGDVYLDFVSVEELPPITVKVEPPGLSWSTYEAGGWSPADTTRQVLVSFERGTELVASRIVTATLDDTAPDEGDIDAAASTSTGDANTVTITNDNSPNVTIEVAHDDSGKSTTFYFGSALPGYSGGVSK